ncbi:RGCVC family protein [Pseudonocardia sp. KRD291]|uniref:RGCVC family protein n=1 Tax=Pseudonocardia sp. KRD291 TaxID=2792007 RepID=UPI001C49F319|nr:RGCVC family protein [Pseudonocardia sp. KRD291]MBW0104003.1 RGCVC family protein [Pseudonocardia sp. KRD291]
MTSAPATSQSDTLEATSGEAESGPVCETCPHPWAAHDAIGRRYCAASIASARTDRGCVCRTV